ncbi:hypothetical protein Hdeb2414_s0008g00280111 [Helianthus debilis subsp. tardiflorus]
MYLTYSKHNNIWNLYMIHLVTRYAFYAFGSVYVTSLRMFAETGLTLSFLSQNLECV